jgi:hypothetical protein
MSCRIIPCSFLAACLAFAGAAVWLPGEAASRHQAEPEPEPATSDARLIAGGCAFFVTFRPGDFLGDELVKTLLQNIPKAIEDELHVAPSGMARLTVATMRQGTVQVVRTKKPYDAEKLRKALATPRYGSTTRAVDRDKSVREERRAPAPGETKAGGKTIYYAGELQRWTPGWCPLDKTTFITGNVASLQALLETRGEPSAEMTGALALGSKYSLVMAIDGKRLRTMFRQQREDTERERREWQKKREERFPDKAAPPGDKDKLSRRGESSREVFVSARLQKEGGGKAKGDDDVDAMFDSLGAGVVLLPYKPLLSARFGLLTLDIGRTHTMSARIDFADKAGLDDGETALKSVLYVGRQLAGMLPKADREFGGLQPLSAPVRKAFEDARVERKGTALSTTVTLTPEAGLAKKVRASIDEEAKKREKMFRGRDKTTTTDKLAPGDKR